MLKVPSTYKVDTPKTTEAQTKAMVKEKLKAIDFMSYISPSPFGMLSVQVDRRLFDTFDDLALMANAGKEAAGFIASQGMTFGEQEVFLQEPKKLTYYCILMDGDVWVSAEPMTMEPLPA